MIMTLDKAINRIADRTKYLADDNHHSKFQRRNQVVDMYGVPFESQGDAQTPATTYVSISQDLIYYERFEFKIVIRPFAMPVGGTGATGYTTVQVNESTVEVNPSTIQINATSLTVTENEGVYTITPNPHTHTSPPHNHTTNPHTHTTVAHNHALDAGITLFPSTISNFRVFIDGINITPYLQAQFPGRWVDGNGVFPTDGIENYDILEACGMLPAWQQGKIMSAGTKKIEFYSDGAFNATLLNYLKLSHCNR